MKLSDLKVGQCFRYYGTLYVVVQTNSLFTKRVPGDVPVMQLDEAGDYTGGGPFTLTCFYDEDMNDEYELVDDL